MLVDAPGKKSTLAPYHKPGFGSMKIEATCVDGTSGATKQVQALRNFCDR